MNIKNKQLLFIALSFITFMSYASFTDMYDKDIKKYYKKFLPIPFKIYGYELLKAQYIQESSLNRMAKSSANAQGISQILPSTWNFISKKLNKTNISPFNTEYSIMYGSYYMKYLRDNWKFKRPEIDRYRLSLASYNAGLGNILKSQKLCDEKLLYTEIIKCLPDITGRHHKETLHYVHNIFNIHRKLKLIN
jgi:membrane-bound lytic murein transglycosylase F